MISKKARKEFTEETQRQMRARREKAIEAYAGKSAIIQTYENLLIQDSPYTIGLRDRVQKLRRGLVNRGVL